MKEPTGYNAMGRPIPTDRMSHALAAVRDMLPDFSTEDAMTLIGGTAERLELDQPYEAMVYARDRGLDLTGQYRLLAVLLAS